MKDQWWQHVLVVAIEIPLPKPAAKKPQEWGVSQPLNTWQYLQYQFCNVWEWKREGQTGIAVWEQAPQHVHQKTLQNSLSSEDIWIILDNYSNSTYKHKLMSGQSLRNSKQHYKDYKMDKKIYCLLRITRPGHVLTEQKNYLKLFLENSSLLKTRTPRNYILLDTSTCFHLWQGRGGL